MKRILDENEKLRAQLAARQSFRPPSSAAPSVSSLPSTPVTPRTPTAALRPQSVSTTASPGTVTSATRGTASSTPEPQSMAKPAKDEPTDPEERLKKLLREADPSVMNELYDLSCKDPCCKHAKYVDYDMQILTSEAFLYPGPCRSSPPVQLMPASGGCASESIAPIGAGCRTGSITSGPSMTSGSCFTCRWWKP